jgi:hypothetical protein
MSALYPLEFQPHLDNPKVVQRLAAGFVDILEVLEEHEESKRRKGKPLSPQQLALIEVLGGDDDGDGADGALTAEDVEWYRGEAGQMAGFLAEYADRHGIDPTPLLSFAEHPGTYHSDVRAVVRGIMLRAKLHAHQLMAAPEVPATGQQQGGFNHPSASTSKVQTPSSPSIPGTSATPNSKLGRRGMPKHEANIQIRTYLAKNPNATARQVASAVGCSAGAVCKSPAWKAVREVRQEGRQPKTPKAIALSTPMEKVIGHEDGELKKLIEEQRADAEPSPLDDASRPRVYRGRSRV